MENVLSVGIDIGTSTTGLVFGLLTVADTAGGFSVPRVSIVKRQVLYRSGMIFTPLLDASRIDGEAIRAFAAAEYARAGYAPADVGTGAVMITGEAARKENAAAVLDRLSGFAGDFVVATAGPDLEAVIAGKGSGACGYSADRGCTAVNIDIGGGTANFALFHRGEALSCGSLDIGGRLVRVGPDRTVDYIAPSAAVLCEAAGIPLRRGGKAGPEALQALCGRMAFLLEQYMGLGPPSPLLARIKTPGSGPFQVDRPVEALFLSGGVGDGVYRDHSDPFAYGDIGVLLARAVRDSALPAAFPLHRPDETLGATVVGAGTCSATLSGGTISADAGLLPLQNLPVLRLSRPVEEACFSGDGAALAGQLIHMAGQYGDSRAAVAMAGRADPDYRDIQRMAAALLQAWDGAGGPDLPLVVVCEGDMAKALGQALARAAPCRGIVSLDGIRLSGGDFLDIGRPLLGGAAVPVVVKTLAFG